MLGNWPSQTMGDFLLKLAAVSANTSQWVCVPSGNPAGAISPEKTWALQRLFIHIFVRMVLTRSCLRSDRSILPKAEPTVSLLKTGRGAPPSSFGATTNYFPAVLEGNIVVEIDVHAAAGAGRVGLATGRFRRVVARILVISTRVAGWTRSR